MTTRYIGRQGSFQGRTLFEIAANLKNLGAGRVVYRNEFLERYPEKSYYVLSKVIPNMAAPNFSYGEAWGYKVFRGAKFPGLKRINAAYKSDWKLIPKEDEEAFCKIDAVYEKEMAEPISDKLPSLMEEIIKQRLADSGKKLDLSLKLIFNSRHNKPNIWKRSTCEIDNSGTLKWRSGLSEKNIN